MALEGDPTAMRLCMERVLPPCRERTVKFTLPPIEAGSTGESCGPSARDVSLAMDAVTSVPPGARSRRARRRRSRVWSTPFVRAIETTKKDGSRLNLLQILTAGDDDDENSADDPDGGDYEETGEYEETDDCDS